MKTLLFFCLVFTLITTTITGQSIKFTMEFDTVSMPKYDYKKMASSNNVQLRMPYASHKFLKPSEVKKLSGATVYEIKLILTDYPKGDDFTTLTQQRLAALFLLDPTLFNNPLTKWTLVYQTACTKEDVYHYFHGFEVVYRPLFTGVDIDYQKTFLRNMMLGETALTDSTILKVMERNDWKNMAIVGDFTGSMTPYIGQLLLWYNLVVGREKSDVNGFVFFNDGNMTPDFEKKIGKTGGIYSTAKANIDSVLQTAVTTIGNGYGGDAPENDIEALLMTQNKLFKESEHYILIADNYSKM